MIRFLIVASALLLATAAASAGDAAAGERKYLLCAGCHGAAGGGNAALKYPPLSGLEAAYVLEQLQAFRSGRRGNATMKAMTAGLNATDMENVAAYIATF